MYRICTLVFLCCFLLFVSSGYAEAITEYSEPAFKSAQAAGKTILLDFHATWCPTCKKQRKVLDVLLKQDKFSKLVAFNVDYDTSSELQSKLGVSRQSTLILYKGEKEIARSIGEVSEESIAQFLSKGL